MTGTLKRRGRPAAGYVPVRVLGWLCLVCLLALKLASVAGLGLGW